MKKLKSSHGKSRCARLIVLENRGGGKLPARALAALALAAGVGAAGTEAARGRPPGNLHAHREMKGDEGRRREMKGDEGRRRAASASEPLAQPSPVLGVHEGLDARLVDRRDDEVEVGQVGIAP